MTHAPDDHDLGLQHDLKTLAEQQLRQRRQMIGWLLSGSAAALVTACGGGSSSDSSASSSSSSSSSSTSSRSSSSSSSSSSSTSTACLADPTETNGPYPSDGSNAVNGSISNILTASGVVRSDIRSSFGSSTTTAPGVPLTLTLNVVNSNTACSPLIGYAVYIWHCTRDGNYSLYSSGLTNENFLRGVQVSDSNGQITFQTIFPGCYSGRYPHIHFEVYPTLASATTYANRVLVSQMAMPRDLCSTVYSGATGYSASVSNLAAVTTSSDNVFGDNSAAQIALQTPSLTGSVASGYTGSILIGVPV